MIESLYLVFYVWMSIGFISAVLMFYAAKEIGDQHE
ncbi:hypothetical protein SAMN05421839_10213 [Halolactibacillus halophilus]|uniref:Uncharacterized protein n=1 Tax=Halolactibacillus halophilus TaxID=306540 RepID=A0A1I5LD24_9BACI|nr:hypothetical protein SAMN05421839_10213 [Halolactibacillus halophilus]